MECPKSGEGYDSFVRLKKCPHEYGDPGYWDRMLKREWKKARESEKDGRGDHSSEERR